MAPGPGIGRGTAAGYLTACAPFPGMVKTPSPLPFLSLFSLRAWNIVRFFSGFLAEKSGA